MIDWLLTLPWWMSLGALLAAWLIVGLIVGPVLGRFCAGAWRDEQ